jgi:hypothetical protein
MRSQLRLQVLLPVAILGILGLGVGAFATTRSGPATSDADAIAARIAAKQRAAEPEKPKKQKKTNPNPNPDPGTQPGPKTTLLQDALQKHAVVVVLFYAPGDDYDTIQTRETRAGALAAHAGFLALDVTQNARVSAIATQYEVREAPATLVFKRGPKLVFRAEGYMDREAIAQAVANAR